MVPVHGCFLMYISTLIRKKKEKKRSTVNVKKIGNALSINFAELGFRGRFH
mgnify:CR=1 FL=1